MKGIELPISTIVVIVLILIVLLAIVGLFYGVWPSGSQAATLASAKANACQMLTSINGCTNDPHDDVTTTIAVNGFDANKDGTNIPGQTYGACAPSPSVAGDNLYMLCECWYNIAGDINYNCKTQVCGCSTG